MTAPTRMTARRLDALLSALSRADDEWEAEESDLDQYGEGPQPDDRASLAEIRAKRALLAEARAIVKQRFRSGK